MANLNLTVTINTTQTAFTSTSVQLPIIKSNNSIAGTGYIVRIMNPVTAEDIRDWSYIATTGNTISLTFSASDIGKTFQIHVCYTDGTPSNNIQKWCMDNPGKISPWSAGALISLIDTPVVTFSRQTKTGSKYSLTGEFQATHDTLKCYSVDNGTTWLYPVAKNKISCSFVTFPDSFQYKTDKGFIGSAVLNQGQFIETIGPGGGSAPGISVSCDTLESAIKVTVSSVSSGNKVAILRNSVICDIVVAAGSTVEWKDYLAEPGVAYTYSAYVVNQSQAKAASPIILPMEDMILHTNEAQLRIRFNPKIDSIKKNTSTTFTSTIGARYPYAQTVGHTKYDTFSISGLISYQSEPLGESKNISLTTNEITQFNSLSGAFKEIAIEKLFRQKVIDFLMADDVKLFKSMTEGNKLVKLSGITLTPMQQLGGLIYTFSAQVTEVAECNIDNYYKYILNASRDIVLSQ